MKPTDTFSNPEIALYRQMALDILKPSARDLEHGFELHRNSLVIESYCLGLQYAIDPEPLNALINAGADRQEVTELYNDMSTTGWVKTPEARREFIEAWEASGVTCSFINGGEEGNDPLRLLRRFARHTYVTDAMPDLMQRIGHPDDIVRAHQAGKRSVCLTMNGVPLTGKISSSEEELSLIRTYAQMGVRMMHLTYNRINLIGGGCGESQEIGLTDFGHATVAEMNRSGVIVDVAHSSWQTGLDAARTSTVPIAVSHSGAHALNDHCRNKPDEVIRAIVERGGTIGVVPVPAFLGRTGDIRALIDHVDYLVKNFGVDAVTISTDKAHTSRDKEAAEQKMIQPPKARARWEGIWPKNNTLRLPEWNKPEQWGSMAWTNWPLFTVALVQRGYSDEDIQKIIGGNFLRLARAVWSGSQLGAIK